MVIIVHNSISFEFQTRMGIRESLFTGVTLIAFKKNPLSKKMSLISAFRQGLWGPDGINYVAKKAPIRGPLAGFGRWVFLPYFGNQGEYPECFFIRSGSDGFTGISGIVFGKRSPNCAYLPSCAELF